MKKSIKIDNIEFINIGTYISRDDYVSRIVHNNIKITDRKSIVYVLVVDNEIMYVGKTIQGYTRPLNYHKNDVMKSVKSGIQKTLTSGQNVDVFTHEPSQIIYGDLTLDIIEAIEQAMIVKHRPCWNNHIQRIIPNMV